MWTTWLPEPIQRLTTHLETWGPSIDCNIYPNKNSFTVKNCAKSTFIKLISITFALYKKKKTSIAFILYKNMWNTKKYQETVIKMKKLKKNCWKFKNKKIKILSCLARVIEYPKIFRKNFNPRKKPFCFNIQWKLKKLPRLSFSLLLAFYEKLRQNYGNFQQLSLYTYGLLYAKSTTFASDPFRFSWNFIILFYPLKNIFENFFKCFEANVYIRIDS